MDQGIFHFKSSTEKEKKNGINIKKGSNNKYLALSIYTAFVVPSKKTIWEQTEREFSSNKDGTSFLGFTKAAVLSNFSKANFVNLRSSGSAFNDMQKKNKEFKKYGF